jgi:hypothetical protein
LTGWQVTAKTIYCDAVDYDVTITFYKDWNTRCTGYQKYIEELDKETAKLLKKRAGRLGKSLKCEGTQDYRVTGYNDKLAAKGQS